MDGKCTLILIIAINVAILFGGLVGSIATKRGIEQALREKGIIK